MKCLFLSSGQPRAHHCHSNATNASPGQQVPWRTNSWWRRALFRALMADKVHRTTQYLFAAQTTVSLFRTFHPRMVSLLVGHWFSIVCCTMKVSCKGPKNTKNNKLIYVLRIFWLNSRSCVLQAISTRRIGLTRRHLLRCCRASHSDAPRHLYICRLM